MQTFLKREPVSFSHHGTSAMKTRYLFAVLGSAGMAIIYGLKVNLSVAIVAMVNQTAISIKSVHNDNSSAADHESTNSLGDTVCKNVRHVTISSHSLHRR